VVKGAFLNVGRYAPFSCAAYIWAPWLDFIIFGSSFGAGPPRLMVEDMKAAELELAERGTLIAVGVGPILLHEREIDRFGVPSRSPLKRLLPREILMR
jgi:hypothetical protein